MSLDPQAGRRVDLDGKEHFGFADGISQPTIEGLSSRTDTPAEHHRAGEFILGYANEYGQYTDRPLLDRRRTRPASCRMDAQGTAKPTSVATARTWCSASSRRTCAASGSFVDAATRTPDGASDPDRRTWLAAQMVGRWPSGAP